MCRPSTSPPAPSTDIFRTCYIAENLVQNLPVTSCSPAPTIKKSTDKTKTLLPEDFEPTEYSVICGNKRKFFNSVGNRRFRVICQMHLAEFMNAPSKHEKSFVVTKVMKAIRSACPVGAFVALEKGRWWQVSDRTSREKVGTFFRDCLSDSYKSSSKNKIAQRRKKYGASPIVTTSSSSVVTPTPVHKRTVTPDCCPLPFIPLADDVLDDDALSALIVEEDDSTPLPVDWDDSILQDSSMDMPFAPPSFVNVPAQVEEDDASSIGCSSAASAVDPVDEFILHFFE